MGDPLPSACKWPRYLQAKWIIVGFGHQTGCNLSFKVTLKAAHYFGFPSYLHFGAGQAVSPKWPPSKCPSQELQGVRHSLAFLFCLPLSVVRVVFLSTLGLKWDLDSGPQRDRSRPAGLLVLVNEDRVRPIGLFLYSSEYHSGEHHRTSNARIWAIGPCVRT